MASAQDLRKRIKSVTNTQQITKAMKMVASARLRRAQTKAEATRPYAEKIGQILRHMSNSDLEGFESPLLDVRPVERTCYIDDFRRFAAKKADASSRKSLSSSSSRFFFSSSLIRLFAA